MSGHAVYGAGRGHETTAAVQIAGTGDRPLNASAVYGRIGLPALFGQKEIPPAGFTDDPAIQQLLK